MPRRSRFQRKPPAATAAPRAQSHPGVPASPRLQDRGAQGPGLRDRGDDGGQDRGGHRALRSAGTSGELTLPCRTASRAPRQAAQADGRRPGAPPGAPGRRTRTAPCAAPGHLAALHRWPRRPPVRRRDRVDPAPASVSAGPNAAQPTAVRRSLAETCGAHGGRGGMGSRNAGDVRRRRQARPAARRQALRQTTVPAASPKPHAIR